MVRTEKINIIASKYAPNPLEVSYWIDLTADNAGGTIKTYNGTEWKIISAKGSGSSTGGGSDESEHVQEIIKTVGLSYNSSTDTITLPSLSSNECFKGSSLVSAIMNGDAAVKLQIDTLTGNITNVETTLGGRITTLSSTVSTLSGAVDTIQSDVTTAKSDIA